MPIGNAADPRLGTRADAVAGMGQVRREVAVARQQDQPLRLVVQPADRVDVIADAPFRRAGR